jgi:hypothetical protein
VRQEQARDAVADEQVQRSMVEHGARFVLENAAMVVDAFPVFAVIEQARRNFFGVRPPATHFLAGIHARVRARDREASHFIDVRRLVNRGVGAPAVQSVAIECASIRAARPKSGRDM